MNHQHHHPHPNNKNSHHEHVHESKHLWQKIKHVLVPHSHNVGASLDNELENNKQGTKALIISFLILGFTALSQLFLAVITGSIAVLGDTLHNFADVFTVVPIAIAFTLGRRAVSTRFTYGLGRSEDLAGLTVIFVIAASALFACYTAIFRILHPSSVHYIGLIAVAALIGCVGNEVVARYRITIGRKIGSAALVADGLHARTDAFASLAVLLSAAGSALNIPYIDAGVGLLITSVILFTLRKAAVEVFARLLDAVDPALVQRIREIVLETENVLGVGEIKLRWIGHTLRAECEIQVDAKINITQAHDIAENLQHALLHQIPRLTAAFVHADPFAEDGMDYHHLAKHHQ